MNKRPLSPHLSIYKVQLNSLTSIMHRITGFGLFLGFSILAWWMIIWIFSKFDSTIFNFINYLFVRICIYLLMAGFFYHLLNGIRHLFWDIGKGYSISSMHKSGWLVIIGTIILMTIFYFITN
ncbi:MAG UNVERIFIED_CONTAM: succinate dehydrogenase, cytochrome b556 subunit [Rickettsiaceae bacterium]|jgi:succinate dehydrogenase / fumarate reductase cytochrome b subunit